MKKLLFLSLFASTALLSQNGLTTYPMPVGNPQTNVKSCITTDNLGNTWVGFQSGIGKFDGVNWTMFDTSNTPMTYTKTSALGVQGANVIWVANTASTFSTGELFSYNGLTWTNYTANINSSYTSSIIADNSNGTVWVGTKTGVYKFDGVTWTNYTVANSGLASDTVWSLAIDPSGNLLAGTQRGLSIRNGNAWTNYNTSNINFPSNSISAIYTDATNGTWLSVGGQVGKFATSFFIPVDSMYAVAVQTYPTSCTSISRGPHGGVIFGGYGVLVEMISNQPTFSYYPTIGQYAFVSYSSINGKTWIVNKLGNTTARPLFAFDGNYTYVLGSTTNALTAFNCRTLDVNFVKTAILNRGDKNWDLTQARYEVPKGGGAHSVFTSSLWIGGLDASGGLHEAAMTYRQNGMDYFPGPLDTTNGSTDSITSAQYDRIWRIQKLKIQEFQYYWSTGAVQNGTYTVDPDILSWPAQGTGNYTRNMAPFVDVDGNGVYNPLTGGDYPLIKGDEMLYCIYNDNLASHTETGGVPLKVEVHASAYAYFCPSVADSQKVINYTTYYDYEIFNRSNVNYNKTYIGAFQDADLGYFQDDYVGCVSKENFSFACNGDPDDGWSPIAQLGTYGAHPPISSLAILNGPLADPGDGIDNDNDGIVDEVGEVNLMTGHFYYNNDFTVIGNPEHADDYYLYSSGKWKDSLDLTYGGNGYGGITPTAFAYDGMMYDTAAWTEVSAGNQPYDRRNVTSCGPFTLNAGQHVNFNYAIVYSRDTTVGPPDSLYYDQAVYDVRRVRNWYNANSTPSCVQWSVGINEPAATASDISLYPNPTSSSLTVQYTPLSTNASYEIIDMTGRVIQQGKMDHSGQTVLSVASYSNGIYLVRVIDGDQMVYRKFIRQ